MLRRHKSVTCALFSFSLSLSLQASIASQKTSVLKYVPATPYMRQHCNLYLYVNYQESKRSSSLISCISCMSVIMLIFIPNSIKSILYNIISLPCFFVLLTLSIWVSMFFKTFESRICLHYRGLVVMVSTGDRVSLV